MAKTGVSATKKRLQELQQTNEQLMSEKKQLEQELRQQHSSHPPSSLWRKLAIVLCVVLATVTLVAGNVLFWASSTLIDSGKYVQTVRLLARDEAIQRAVADYTTTQLFRQVNVGQVIQGALPPRAAFLAPQLTSQLHGATDTALQKVVASNKFQTLWVNTNRSAHQKLITSIKNAKGDGVINLQDVYDNLGKSLTGTKLSFLAGKSLPNNIGSIDVIHAPWVPKARIVVNDSSWLKPTALLMVAIFSAGAIWLSRNRRKAVTTLASFFSASMVLLLVAVQLTRHAVATQVAPMYQTAADHAAGIITHTLVLQTVTLLLLSLLILLISWLTGPCDWAISLRNNFYRYITTPLHHTLFGRQESSFTKWITGYRQLIEWGIVTLVSLVILWVRLSPKLVIGYALLMLALVFITETLAAPHSKR